MREHVYLSESLFNKGPISRRVGQNGPIAAWNVALFERFKPEFSQPCGARRLRKASNSCLMSFIQCLVQQFSEKTVTSRGAHPVGMQNVIRGDLGIGLACLNEKLA